MAAGQAVIRAGVLEGSRHPPASGRRRMTGRSGLRSRPKTVGTSRVGTVLPQHTAAFALPSPLVQASRGATTARQVVVGLVNGGFLVG